MNPRPSTWLLAAMLVVAGLAIAPVAVADERERTKPPDSSSAPQPSRSESSTDPDDDDHRTPTTGGTTVPSGVSVSGLRAGSGSVDIREYIDLSSGASGAAHHRIVGPLLSRVAAEGLGSISLRPLITSTNLNSTEAGCAVLAAGRQNKAWDVTSALFRAQSLGGDWVSPSMLRRLGTRIPGLKVSRFVSDARGPANYSSLNAIRSEAKNAGVTVTPAFVVRGPRGTKLITRPNSAAAVIDAIKSVQ